tara:strand:- start:395 stop:1012 length:618 start_codon:yes stop_codon:yes gene_type:complete
MDEERKKKSEEEIILQKEIDAYAVDEEVEAFAAKMADREDNPTIHELAKQLPEKTYKALENYRDSDRHEESKQIPLTEAQKNLVEHIEAGTCIMGKMRKDREFEKEIDYHRYWKDMYEKEHKLRQEAETETILVKGIGQNSPEMKEAKLKIKELEEGLANALAVNESHQRLNGKLQMRITELEDDNKSMHDEVNKNLENARKAGL